MQGFTGFDAPPPPTMSGQMANYANQSATSAMSAIGNTAIPAVGVAGMAGSMFLKGGMGKAAGMLDPFTAGLQGFGKGAGWQSGAGFMKNMGMYGKMGARGMMGAAAGGLGAAAMAAAPIMAATSAAQYGVGQMVQGAQFQNQVGGFMQQNFRHQNANAAGGFGFDRQETGQISDMIRGMGHKDMMTGPQELLKVMKAGTGMGMFRAVQDVKKFKEKFKGMVDSLKTIAKTMHTTLEGAMPFFQQAQLQGFWSPEDIMRHATTARSTAKATGMSVAQVQQAGQAGAQMSRAVGGLSAHGSEGMMKTMGMVGSAMRSGTINEQQVFEATGMRGAEGVRAVSHRMQASATRFASGRRGRWMLAALGGKGFKGLDEGAMGMLESGGFGLSEIRKKAQGSLSGEGKYDFVLNEKKLRGDLLSRGPAAQMGLAKTLAGKHLYGESGRSQLYTRRIIRKIFGASGKQAEMIKEMMKNAEKDQEDKLSRLEAQMDQEARNRDQMLNNSYEGFKRKASGWWDQNVKEPAQGYGARLSRRVADSIENMGDSLWGRASKQYRLQGMTGGAVTGLQRGGRHEEAMFGTADSMRKLTGSESVKDFLSMGKPSDEQVAALGALGSSSMAGERVVNRLRQGLAGALGGRSEESMGKGGLGFASSAAGAAALKSAGESLEGSGYSGAIYRGKQKGHTGLALARYVADEARAGKAGADLKELTTGIPADVAALRIIGADQTSGIKAISVGAESGVFGAMSSGDFRGAEKKLEEMESKVIGGRGFGKKYVTETKERGIQNYWRRLIEGKDKEMVTTSGTVSIPGLRGVKAGDMKKLLAREDVQDAVSQLASNNTKNKTEGRNALDKILMSLDQDSSEAKILYGFLHGGKETKEYLSGKFEAAGTIQQLRRRVSGAEVVSQRNKRLAASLVGNESEIMEGLNKAGGMGDIVRDLMGTSDMSSYTEKLGDLAGAAAEGDFEQVMRGSALLKGRQGAGMLTTAMQQGAAAGLSAKRLGITRGRRGKGGAVEANRLLSGFGASITAKQLKKLKKGDAGAIDQVLEGVSDDNKEDVRKMLEYIQTGDTPGMQQLGVKGAVRHALGVGTTGKTAIDKQVKKMDPNNLIGSLGTTAGMHVQMLKMTQILEQIRTGDKAARTGNPQPPSGASDTNVKQSKKPSGTLPMEEPTSK
jgi:hypothetical protein